MFLQHSCAVFFIIWFLVYLIACLTMTLLNLESMLSPCQPELVDHFDPYNVFLTIATNIPVQLMTYVLWSRVTYIQAKLI